LQILKVKLSRFVYLGLNISEILDFLYFLYNKDIGI
jgi:hypothetical protein